MSGIGVIGKIKGNLTQYRGFWQSPEGMMDEGRPHSLNLLDPLPARRL
jgi:hypothetical protein